jgi:hypothetical protein
MMDDDDPGAALFALDVIIIVYPVNSITHSSTDSEQELVFKAKVK